MLNHSHNTNSNIKPHYYNGDNFGLSDLLLLETTVENIIKGINRINERLNKLELEQSLVINELAKRVEHLQNQITPTILKAYKNNIKNNKVKKYGETR